MDLLEEMLSSYANYDYPLLAPSRRTCFRTYLFVGSSVINTFMYDEKGNLPTLAMKMWLFLFVAAHVANFNTFYNSY